jgi:hypothetical protein
MASVHSLLINNRNVFTSKLVEAFILLAVRDFTLLPLSSWELRPSVCLFHLSKIISLTLFTCDVTPLDTKFHKKFHE